MLHIRPKKRKRPQLVLDGEDDDALSSKILASVHPMGIKPLGNYYIDSLEPDFPVHRDTRSVSLGGLSRLTDELLIQLLGYLDPTDFCKLCCTSKVLYVFCSYEEFWKNFVVKSFAGNFSFVHSWKETYAKESSKKRGRKWNYTPAEIKVKYFYSDVLFHPFYSSSADLEVYSRTTDNIPRRSNLSVDDFVKEYAVPNRPVIITDVVDKWPAYKKWTKEYLRQKFGEKVFRAEAVDIKLNDYFAYADGAVNEDSPLYLFDRSFGETCPELLEDFKVPEYFSRDDFFKLLGKERPDYRWLIMGPAKSGSTFHKDPNGTSAFNAVIKGKKKWILYPPDVLPPGVFTSEDEGEVTAPVSVMEWFVNFYPATRKQLPRPIEGICNEGEVMFVPHGWWHCVLNLEESIAVTQNYISRENLIPVLHFLKNKKDQITGTQDKQNLHDKLVQKLKEAYPDLLETLLKEEEEKEMARPKSFWEKMKEAGPAPKQFKFSFDV